MNKKVENQNQSHPGYPSNFYYPGAYQFYYPYRNSQPQAQQQIPIPFAQPQPTSITQTVASPHMQGTTQGTSSGMPNQLPPQQSYIENILRLNQGKEVDVHMNFEECNQPEKVFTGVIEAAGRDHIVLSNRETGKQFLLLMVYLDYVVFNEEINYNPSFGSGPGLFTAPVRRK